MPALSAVFQGSLHVFGTILPFCSGTWLDPNSEIMVSVSQCFSDKEQGASIRTTGVVLARVGGS